MIDARPESRQLERPKLFVYVGHTGKHLLRHIRSRKVRIYPKDHPGPFGPDMVLFQSSQTIDFVDAAAALDDSVWSKARAGAGKVVFDASLEGRPHEPERTEALHALLAAVGLPLDAGVYVTQDRRYGEDYRAYCAARGLLRTMRIVCYDFWIRRFVRDYEQGGEAVFAERLARFRARAPRRARRFVSLNMTPRPAKALFLLSLMRDGLWEQGYISFGGFDRIRRVRDKSLEQFKKDLDNLRGFEDLVRELSPRLADLDALGRVLLGRKADVEDPDGAVQGDEALEEHGQSWFSVVTETEMMDRPCRITEKSLKALFNFHPLIVFGNPGALAMVRRLGFQTFEGVIDESYDEEPDPRRRFDMAYAEVRRLCAMDEADLAAIEGRIAEILAFNAEWGLTKLPAIYRDRIDPAVIDEILAAAPQASVSP